MQIHTNNIHQLLQKPLTVKINTDTELSPNLSKKNKN